jgi:predicted AAA+ superfamily ATPase
MDFEEFLMALGEDQLLKLMHNHDYELMNAFHEKLKDYLRQYYYVGGMPEVVKHYVENKLLNQVRTIQNEILSNYAGDFSKHAPTQEVPRIDMVWQSILGQLSKENKKFVYGVLKKGGRAKEFELAIQWLIDAGLIYKTTKVTKPELPLKFYEDISAFKLYLCDCGLMGAMADTDAKNVLISDIVVCRAARVVGCRPLRDVYGAVLGEHLSPKCLLQVCRGGLRLLRQSQPVRTVCSMRSLPSRHRALR